MKNALCRQRKDRRQKTLAYGLTDELVDNLLQGSTNYEVIVGEGGIFYRALTKRLFEYICWKRRYLIISATVNIEKTRAEEPSYRE